MNRLGRGYSFEGFAQLKSWARIETLCGCVDGPGPRRFAQLKSWARIETEHERATDHGGEVSPS